MRSSNPALSEDTFVEASRESQGSSVMTISGSVLKTTILTVILTASAAVSWILVSGGAYTATDAVPVAPNPMYRLLFGAGAPILAFILAMVITWFPKTSPILAPAYATLEGFFLGAISSWINDKYEGLALEAAVISIGTLFVMLMLYASRWIVVTDKLRMGIVAATGGICMAYLASFLINIFGFKFPYLHDDGIISIGFSVFVVIIAALNFVLDFEMIEVGAKQRAPKYMEWYAGFGLLLTLVWLYLEVLRLLAKLRNND